MKQIEVDDDLYHYIAAQTQNIGESASDILRRLLGVKAPVVGKVPSTSTREEAPSVKEVGSTNLNTDRVPDYEIAKLVVENSEIVKPIITLLQTPSFTAEPKSIVRFIKLLSALYQISPQTFANACDFRGKKRAYFGRSAEQLLEVGKTTRPRAIPSTPFWVITNLNTKRKQVVLRQLMSNMGFEEQAIELICEAV